MIPFARIRAWQPRDKGGWTRFTRDEQQTLMSLWAIAQSPLIFGGHLPETDEATLAMLTNAAVIRVNQAGSHPRQLRREGDSVVWVSDGSNGAKNVALFNLADSAATVSVTLDEIGVAGPASVIDCWQSSDSAAKLSRKLPPHGSALLVVTPKNGR
jgi:hypothetical protein